MLRSHAAKGAVCAKLHSVKKKLGSGLTNRDLYHYIDNESHMVLKMSHDEKKRKAPRMAVDYEFFMDYRGHVYSGKSHDISQYGMGVFVDESLTLGEKVDLTLVIKDLNINFNIKGEVSYCKENPDKSEHSHRYLAGIEFTDGHEKVIPYIEKKQVSRYSPSHTISINADVEKCYKLIAEFERYPEWTTGIGKARVVERYPDGRGKMVEFEYNFYIRKFRYVLDYSYDDENNILSWVSAGGDEELLGNVGSYTFLPRGEGKTSATFQSEITISFVPSQRIINYFTTVVIRKEMKNFKRFVEKQNR